MSNSIVATVVLAAVSVIALAPPVPKEPPLIPQPTLKIGSPVYGITFSGNG